KSSIDSTIVFVAHYDHLGHLGKDIYYPGANDNASGTAMLLSLAEYYSKKENAPNYNIVFLSVAGEEVGLLGSTHYTENPLLPLDKIKYLINLDMIADNSKDVYVEISPEGEKGLERFNSINSRLNLFTKLDKGELAANSDHYPFAQKHVPSIFFIMETGDAFKIYHTLQDSYENLYIDNYQKMFTLLTEFVKE
ncbi:MAG: M28 family peptidase, partial [Bacteroidales bacterium]